MSSNTRTEAKDTGSQQQKINKLPTMQFNIQQTIKLIVSLDNYLG